MKPAKTSRVEVVVIKAMDYGEADKILTLYTPTLGKVHAVAKGVRRTTSRMGGHLDLFAHASVLLVHGRTLDIVTQGQGLHLFPRLRDDLNRFALACYAAELIDRFTEDASPNPELFRALIRVLDQIDRATEARAERPMLLFVLQLLALSGYRPQLHRCVACETVIAPGNNAFEPSLGGALCPDCAGAQYTAQPISTPTLKLLRNLQMRGDAMVVVAVPQQVLDEAERALSLYVQYLLERRPRSAAFLDSMRRSVTV